MFNRLKSAVESATERLSTPFRSRTITYQKVTTIGPDSKTIKETTILDDGGQAETPEEVKRSRQRMENMSRQMDKVCEHMDGLFNELSKLF